MRSSKRIVFVQPDPVPWIGTMTLASCLASRGHSAEVLIEALEARPLEALRRLRPDLVGFHVMTPNLDWTLRWAGRVKRKLGIPTIVGGPHATFEPAVALRPEVDYACRGEGEEALGELLDALAGGTPTSGIRNLAFERGGALVVNEMRPYVHPLDDLPDPDFAPYDRYPLLRSYIRHLYPSIGGRGCPYDCLFCYVPKYREIYRGKGKPIRWRSPERFVQELRAARDRWGVRRFLFVDDTFILDPRGWFAEFGDRYARELRLPFVCQTTASTLDAETVARLRRMGCVWVCFGIENGDERVRTRVLKKEVSDAAIVEGAALLRRAGIRFQTSQIFGLPGEDLEGALRTYRLNRAIGSNYMTTTLLAAYPGTDVPLLSATRDPQGVLGTPPPPLPEVPRAIVCLQRLAPVLHALGVPEGWARRLAPRFPLSWAALLHDLSIGYFVKRLSGMPWTTFLRMSLATRRYLSVKRRTPAELAGKGPGTPPSEDAARPPRAPRLSPLPPTTMAAAG